LTGRDVHLFFGYAPIGKQKLFGEHFVCQRLLSDDFTVYDVLVCGELQWDYHPDRYFSAKLWSDYQAYTQAVIKAAPADLS
jgi:hypothetical protein